MVSRAYDQDPADDRRADQTCGCSVRNRGRPNPCVQPEPGCGRTDGGEAPAGGAEPGGPGGPRRHEAVGGLVPGKGVRGDGVRRKSGAGTKQFAAAVKTLLADKLRAYAEKGQNRVVRVMILGIPNVGKSTFINQVAGRKTAKTEDRPGVTRSKQWVPSTGI